MIEKKYLTKNKTYTNPTTIKPQYVIVHSVGTQYFPTKDKLFTSWDKSAASKSVHGMVDDNGSWVTLPLTYKGWHVGGKGNDKTVGFEICEPSNIAYADEAHTKLDLNKYSPTNASNKADFTKRYNNAVEIAAYMCEELNIPVANVLCHQEAAKKGIASNHADVLHWFPAFGKSMDDFRADVKKKLGKPVVNESPKTNASYMVKVTTDVLNIRKGAGTNYGIAGQIRDRGCYTITEVKGTWGKLQSGLGWISLKYTKKI